MSWYDGLTIGWKKSISWTGFTKMKIDIYRMEWTDRGVFGHLVMPGFDCITLERMDTLIPCGTYKASLYDSPKNKCKVVLLEGVPGRSLIEIHPADYQNELEGCIALASRRRDVMNMKADVFASDRNKATFNAFMEKLKGVDEISVAVR